MYVCICNAITDKDIRHAASRGANDLGELQDRLGVATCCGSCADQAREILDDVHGQRRTAQPAVFVPFPA